MEARCQWNFLNARYSLKLVTPHEFKNLPLCYLIKLIIQLCYICVGLQREVHHLRRKNDNLAKDQVRKGFSMAV